MSKGNQVFIPESVIKKNNHYKKIIYNIYIFSYI